MKKIKYLILGISLFAIFSNISSAYAQNKVNIQQIILKHPMVNDFGYFYDNRNIAILVQNVTNQRIENIVLSGYIRGDNGAELSLKQDRNLQDPFSIESKQTKTLSSSEIDGLINNNTVASNIKDLDLSVRTNRLPAGFYTYCLRAIDKETGDILGEEACTEFAVLHIDPPILSMPFDESSIEDKINIQPILFQWILSKNDFKPNVVENRLQIVELQPNQDPNEAFRTAQDLFFEVALESQQSNYYYTQSNPILTSGNRYAWRVKFQEKDQTEPIPFENGGLSEVWTFTYQPDKQNETEDFYVKAVYPPDGEAIPSNNKVTAECGGCKFPDISDKTEDTNYLKVGAIIKIGSQNGFQVKIISIKNGSGEGILGIKIKDLGKVDLGNGKSFAVGEIPMKVELKGVGVNKDGILIAGEITSKHKDGVGLNLVTDFKTVNDPNEYKSLQGDLIKKWNAVKAEIESIPNTTATAINNAGYTTPLGFSEDIAGVQTTIAFDNFKFTPTSNSFSAYSIVEVKDEDIVIPFGVQGTCLGIDGACQDYTLFLAKNVPMSNFTLKGNTDDIKKATHLKYSFNGPRKFQNIHIAAEYEFKDNILKPKEGNEKVKVEMVADSPNGFADWTATVSVPPFKVAGVEDFIFELDGTATYDHSTKAQPTGMKTMLDNLKSKKDAVGNFAINTDGQNAINEMQNDIWMGFYLPKLKVQLPEIFKADQKDNVEISVEHLIIDSKHGLCGSLTAENVFGIGAGNLDGWYFSLDKIDLSFFNNTFLESSASGKVVLPISGNPTIDNKGKALSNNATNAEVTPLYYKMILSPNEGKSLKYQFIIKPIDDVNVPIWKANMKLEKSSNITVTVGDPNVYNGKILVKAELNGNISFDFGKAAKDATGFPIPDFKLDLMTFQGFKIQSKEPYIDLGKYDSNVLEQGSKVYDGFNNFASAFASPQKSINGFPLTLDKFEPFIKINKAGFLLAGGLEMSDIPLKPVAKVGIAILAKIDFKDGRPVFAYDGVELDSVYIAGKLGPVSVKGGLRFYNSHPVYGNGIGGNFTATFPMEIEVNAEAKFGRTDFSYWYVYASAKFPGISLVGPLRLTGFGGGAYHNMTGKSTSLGINDLGKIPTTPIYTPLKGTTGIKAGIDVNVVDNRIVKAQAILGVEFGVNNNITLEGAAQVINSDATTSDKGSGMLNAEILATYDINQSVFDLVGSVHANQAGISLDIDKGLLIHISSDEDFYLNVGTPKNRIKASLIGLASVDGYFMFGTNIPDIPAPNVPAEVLPKLNYYPIMKASSLASGIAFGASFNTSANFDLVFVDGGYSAGFGMDVNLRNIAGEGCDGYQPAGYNGWYGQGSIYGYIKAHVRAPLLGSCNVGLYARISAGVPNPSWIDGSIYVENPVKDFSLPIRIGDKCVVHTNPFVKPNLISEINFNENEKVSVFKSPIIIQLNYPLEFEVDGLDKDGNPIIEKFKIEVEAEYKGKTSARVSTNNTPADILKKEGQILVWTINDAFAPEKQYELIVNAKAFVKKGNEVFKPFEWKGKAVTENKIIKFTTDKMPERLDEQINAHLPFKKQKYVLADEIKRGGLGLKQSVNFDYYSTSNMTYEKQPSILLINNKTNTQTEVKTYGSGIWFPYEMPKLDKNTSYTVKLALKATPIKRSFDLTKTAYNKNIDSRNQLKYSNKQSEKQTNFAVADPTFTFSRSINLNKYRTEKQIEIEYNKENKILYEYHFKTSEYGTFNEKIKASQLDFNLNGTVNHLFISLGTENEIEPLSKFDVLPQDFQKQPLIDISSNANSTSYFNKVLRVMDEKLEGSGVKNYSHELIDPKWRWYRFTEKIKTSFYNYDNSEYSFYGEMTSYKNNESTRQLQNIVNNRLIAKQANSPNIAVNTLQVGGISFDYSYEEIITNHEVLKNELNAILANYTLWKNAFRTRLYGCDNISDASQKNNCFAKITSDSKNQYGDKSSIYFTNGFRKPDLIRNLIDFTKINSKPIEEDQSVHIRYNGQIFGTIDKGEEIKFRTSNENQYED